MAANAPIFLYIPKHKEITIAKSNMPYEDYCYIYSMPEELKEKITAVLNGNDYLADNRLKAIDYIIGLTETKNNNFINRLQKLIGDYNV